MRTQHIHCLLALSFLSPHKGEFCVENNPEGPAWSGADASTQSCYLLNRLEYEAQF